MRCTVLFAIALLGSTAPTTGFARECRNHDPLRTPFFGDLHVHTHYSADAFSQGTRLTPRDAYRFARGEAVGLQPFDEKRLPQRSAQLRRPLDFAAVTDHSESFGSVHLCARTNSSVYDAVACRIARRWPRLSFFGFSANCDQADGDCERFEAEAWRTMQDAAAEANDETEACEFTSFVGFEWTAAEQAVRNLHRNVIFRNASVPNAALPSYRHPTPEALWTALDETCRGAEPTCDAIVIPHNSNLSGGLMFAPREEPFDAEYAERRANYERLVEVIQHKGSSECRVGAGTTDELCDFEILPYADFMGRFLPVSASAPPPISFTRTAHGEGLRWRQRLGVNPFEFGLIGSTDTHLGTPGWSAEDTHEGHGGAGISIGEILPEGLLDPIEYNPGGLAVLWAEENSRESLFTAMQRREAYATSGPRIVVRFFGGWDYSDDLCNDASVAEIGYARGVPMGGRLTRNLDQESPRFVVHALRDPDARAAPLERIQIIKLWVENEVVRESVVDVAGGASDATVDLSTCERSGGGANALCGVWRDPDFSPEQDALYYARIVEVPTCRWSTYACNRAGVRCETGPIPLGYEDCCNPEFPRTIRERAWTSPIWYVPDAPAPPTEPALETGAAAHAGPNRSPGAPSEHRAPTSTRLPLQGAVS